MYERILVPLDGSEASEVALTFVRLLASQSVLLLRVEPSENLLIPPSVTGVEPDWKDRFAVQVRRELELVAKRFPNIGTKVEVEVRFGDAAEEIIAVAEGADLIVMTTHGRGAAGRLIFGSTADRVSRYGTVPTLLIRLSDDSNGPVMPSRVVVPLDGSDLAEEALPEAEKLARVLDVPIHLVRAVGNNEIIATVRNERAAPLSGTSNETEVYERAREETEREAAEYLEAMARSPQEGGLTTGVEVLKGTAAFVLLWMIQPNDVVVMATHGLGGFRRWVIGSVAEKLVREAAGPVLLVRNATDFARKSKTESQSSS